MTTWTERIIVAFPESMLADANRLAAIIDPDTGGALTFSADQTRGGYIYADIPLMTHFEPVVRERDPDTWQAVLASLADEKGVERLDPATVETLRAAMLFGADECAALEST
jgi:hypothetical protein